MCQLMAKPQSSRVSFLFSSNFSCRLLVTSGLKCYLQKNLYIKSVASLLRNVFEVRNLSTMSLRSEAGVKILSQHSPLQASVFNPLSVLYHIVQNISVSVTNGSFNCHIRVCYRERASVFTKCPVSQYLMVISGWIIVLRLR